MKDVLAIIVAAIGLLAGAPTHPHPGDRRAGEERAREHRRSGR